jgi:hypothetical protein
MNKVTELSDIEMSAPSVFTDNVARKVKELIE